MIATRRIFHTSWATKALFLLGLLGFIAGWANACVHHEALQRVGGSGQAAHAPASPGHGPHAPGDDERPRCDAALDDCAGLCDHPQGPLPKPEPQRCVDGAAWPAAIHAVAAAWAIDRVTPLERPQIRISPPAISVVLRFLRLTL